MAVGRHYGVGRFGHRSGGERGGEEEIVVVGYRLTGFVHSFHETLREDTEAEEHRNAYQGDDADAQ